MDLEPAAGKEAAPRHRRQEVANGCGEFFSSTTRRKSPSCFPLRYAIEATKFSPPALPPASTISSPSNAPDALVLDCSVYNMSESLFDAVRENPDQAELSVVIISDTPEEADASLRSRNAQKVVLIPKPFTGAARCKSARRAPEMNKPLWSMDDWNYLEREAVTDPKGRRWTVALMDVLDRKAIPISEQIARTSVFLRPFISHSSTTRRAACSGNGATQYCQKRRPTTKPW